MYLFWPYPSIVVRRLLPKHFNKIALNDVFNPCNEHLSDVFPIQQDVWPLLFGLAV
jgi:hypothetical protein